jgi:hypothetical protein
MANAAFHAVGAVTASGNNVTTPVTLSPALPTRFSSDVLLLFVWSAQITMTVTTPAGWTLLTTQTSGTALGGRLFVFGRAVDGAETAPSCVIGSLTTGTTGTPASTVVASYSHVDISQGIANILDGTVTLSDQAASTTTVTIPSVTTALLNSLAIGFACKLAELSATFTPPSGWSEELDTLTTSGTGYQSEISDKSFASAGATGSVTCAPSVTTSSRAIGVALALKSEVAAASRQSVVVGAAVAPRALTR